MRAVFGIGNPGSRYENTRHNAGFIILDRFAEKRRLSFLPGKENYYYTRGAIGSSSFILIKPTTYVNLSGQAAAHIINELNIRPEEFLVVYDDINLETGNIRLRKSGGDGGHNGMHSLIYYLETDNFPRLRFGIGNNFDKGDMAQYVLSPFKKEELQNLDDSFSLSESLIEEFIKGGFQDSLNFFSKFKQSKGNISANTQSSD